MRKFVERSLSVESKEVKLSGTLKGLWYFCLSMAALILSACFPVVERQLIILSLIAGAKWVVIGMSTKINILMK